MFILRLELKFHFNNSLTFRANIYLINYQSENFNFDQRTLKAHKKLQPNFVGRMDNGGRKRDSRLFEIKCRA
ncbi:hypothetical protein JHK85_008019 [Glycine max]|uniref:Uncharacterized protein n=2 Tax=Glycine subgen. Soja TaxID=1462606 RepID=K7KFQ9_SOYBN|nr:hypothetical protein JHK87_007638 [Glycine soja]KAG5055509.1 hypothetical protein JHK85_008019 [Glycine max]KAH1070540.1 hypothetical protein GYH30_007556 [Glycine max]KHN09463.1 hypothetical protein glysoja_016562 [Glycine soja]RZC21220.1 hypothetical protein D0Y65_007475 [Glycine soja]